MVTRLVENIRSFFKNADISSIIMKIFNRPTTLVENHKQQWVDKRVDEGDMKRDLGGILVVFSVFLVF